MTPTIAMPPRSPFLRRLHGAIFAELTPTIELAQQIAVLQAAGHRRGEIARALDADPADMRAAQALLRRATQRLAQED